MARLKIFQFIIFVALISISAQSENNSIDSRKLDEENKCGGCPCNNPCNPPSPPPPPPSPPPPPPKRQPPSSNCPPPPSGGGSGGGGGGGQNPPYLPSTPSAPYIFINGPPQDLYPVDNFSGSGRVFSTGPVRLLIGGFVGLFL
ncbi:proline-rich family protein [Striga asiatica]|uniref:Proline-rich family protein n=1 Tax=Striga asiatica TaxID=4170 RepID=A0A5A7QH38_STRAF|nr:proline-rich family protein [Striga asiatica]